MFKRRRDSGAAAEPQRYRAQYRTRYVLDSSTGSIERVLRGLG